MIDTRWGFLGAVIAATAAASYVLWGPSEKKNTKRKDLCPGLENLGNTCFLNAILQAWASCPSVCQWLAAVVVRQTSRENCQDSLAAAVEKTLNVLNNNDPDMRFDVYSPGAVIKALRLRGWVISSDEQDAHELFHALTETLDEETAKYPRVVSLFDLKTLQSPLNRYQPVGAAVTRSNGLLPVLPHREIEQPFSGLLASQLQCKECGYRFPIRYDLFDSLSLSLPNNIWGAVDLDMLLQNFIRSETVENVECLNCAKVKTSVKSGSTPKTTCRKKLTIGKLPQCLCMHIKRTLWLDNGVPVKRYEYVSFPEQLHMDDYVYKKASPSETDVRKGLVGGVDTLSFRPSGSSVNASSSRPVNLLRTLNYDSRSMKTGMFLQPPNPVVTPNGDSDVNHNGPVPGLPGHPIREHTYKLTAVVAHLGDVFSGHFVTYRRNVHCGSLSDKWVYTSDMNVRREPMKEVLSAEAYMLYYERQ